MWGNMTLGGKEQGIIGPIVHQSSLIFPYPIQAVTTIAAVTITTVATTTTTLTTEEAFNEYPSTAGEPGSHPPQHSEHRTNDQQQQV